MDSVIFSVGLGSALAFVGMLIVAAWALFKIMFGQFETRLNEKFKTLDTAVGEIKRLELEIVRNDARAAQIYTTKIDNEKALERIFVVMERMEVCLHLKISREEVERLIANRNINPLK